MEHNALNYDPADQRPEEIEEAMRRTRMQLNAKVTALEQQVVGTAKSATDAVSSTVNSIRSLFAGPSGGGPDTRAIVGDTVSALTDTVDLSTPIRQNPMAALGLAVGAGFLTGFLVTDRRDDAVAAPGPAFTPAAGPGPYPPPLPRPAKPPGVFDELMGLIGRKLREVAEAAIDTTSASVKHKVHEEAPHVVDQVAQRLTGTPPPPPAPAYSYADRRTM